MNKLLIIDKNNKMLVSMDTTEGEEILVDNSIELTSSNDTMVIKLKEDYRTHGNAIVKIVDGEIKYIMPNDE